MKERPILFSAPMVRAIIEGRKTQTRRVVKPQPIACDEYVGGAFIERRAGRTDGGQDRTAVGGPSDYVARVCPYGRIGDRLWVRETWNIAFRDDLAPNEQFGKSKEECIRDNHGFGAACAHGVVYAATNALEHPAFGKALWRPSIHMPRWASRILLEITDVRVERVQDIKEEDAITEGIRELPLQEREPGAWWCADPFGNPSLHYRTPRCAFSALWDSINAKRGFGWNANPWVWALTFKRVTP